jgi:hypothetical protein
MKLEDISGITKAQYGDADQLRAVLAKFVTYCQMHNRVDLSAWFETLAADLVANHLPQEPEA